MNYLGCLNGVTDFEETKKILTEQKLQIKECESLFLIKYNKEECDMNDPDIRKCRGLVLEKDTNKLVCVPPPKSEAVEIFNKVPGEKTIYEEFVEGTMINIFKYNGKPYMSTRSCINAYCKFYSNKTFNTLFSEIIDLDKFDVISDTMNLTFILQHPENIIVKQYTKPNIKLVYGVSIENGLIKNYDLLELKTMLSEKGLTFDIPETFVVENVKEVYDILNKLDYNHQRIILKNLEYNYLRSKIRNNDYNHVRKLKGNSNNKKYLYLELRKSKSLEEYLKYFSEDSEMFELYRLELYETTTKLFNFYQNYHVRKNEEGKRVISNFLDIDYEYRPLCNGLHDIYLNTKQKTDKRAVIKYINSLPPAQLLFVINYKYRK